MNTYPYLINRNGVFYFRRIIPISLRSILGRLEVIRSLRTPDIRTARKAVLRMSERLDELFAKIRSGERLLSKQDRKLLADHFVESRTKKLLLEAEEDYYNKRVLKVS